MHEPKVGEKWYSKINGASVTVTKVTEQEVYFKCGIDDEEMSMPHEGWQELMSPTE